MEKWRAELTFGGQNLGTVRLRRDILQEDNLSPLLFVDIFLKLRLDIIWDIYWEKSYSQNGEQFEILVNTVGIFIRDIRI